MGYSVSLPLLKKANKEAIMAAFNLFPYTDYNDYLSMSDDPDDHGYSKTIKNGIFYSYKCMPNDAHYYLWFFSSLIVSKFGLTKKCKVTDKSYPYFYYDGIIVYVIPKEDRSAFDHSGLKFNVLQDVDDIDIHSHMSKKVKGTYEQEEFNLLFGDNDLLKEYCKNLLNVVGEIN
jgi:hypothetical protein